MRASLSLLPWSSPLGRESLHMQGRCRGYWAGSVCGAQVLAGGLVPRIPPYADPDWKGAVCYKLGVVGLGVGTKDGV